MKGFGWRCHTLSSDQLCQYVVYIHDNDKMKVSSIRTSFTNLKGFLSYFTSKLPDLSDVDITLDGLSRCSVQTIKQASPIQGEHLAKLEKLFTGYDFDASNATTSRTYLTVDKLQFITISTVAHNGSFRINELLNMTWDNVLKTDNGYRLTIDHSKMNQQGPPQDVFVIYHDGNHTSGASWLDIYKQRCPSHYWVFPHLSKENIPLPYSQFNRSVKYYTKQMGLDAKLFSSHSFRSGCTTDMIEAQVHPENIRKHARWASMDMISRYSRPDEYTWQSTLQDIFDGTGGSHRAKKPRGSSPHL